LKINNYIFPWMSLRASISMLALFHLCHSCGVCTLRDCLSCFVRDRAAGDVALVKDGGRK